MSSHLVFDGVDAAARADLQRYWATKKLPRLNKLTVHYPTDRRDIWVTIHREQASPLREWYGARAVVHLPTGSLADEADEKDPEVVLDQLADALAARIKRHLEQVRRDYVFKRKGRQRSDLGAMAPLLQRDVESGRRADFFRLLRPQLRFLRDHARRELRILELEGPLHRREVAVNDLLDEVANRAWQRFGQRPRHLPLDLWLTSLFHEVLKEWVKQEPRPHVSLEDKPEEAAAPQDLPPLEAK